MITEAISLSSLFSSTLAGHLNCGRASMLMREEHLLHESGTGVKLLAPA
jgi:hypothetical protein